MLTPEITLKCLLTRTTNSTYSFFYKIIIKKKIISIKILFEYRV